MPVKGIPTFSDQSLMSHRALASLSSGCLSTIVGFPLETMRVRLLLDNSIGAVKTLNHGLSLGLSLSVLKAGGVWPIQEAMKEHFEQHQLSKGYETMVSGGISNVLPNCLLAPGSIVRVRLMRDHISQTASAVARSIFKTHGLLGFYQGTGITIGRDLVWGVLYFTAFERIGKALTDHNPTCDQTVHDAMSSFGAGACATLPTAWIDAARLHTMNKDRVTGESLLKIFGRSLVLTRINIIATFLGTLRVGLAVATAHTSYRKVMDYLENPPLLDQAQNL